MSTDIEKIIEQYNLDIDPKELKKLLKDFGESIEERNNSKLETLYPYEVEVYDELVKSIDVDFYKKLLEDQMGVQSFRKHIPSKEGKGFLVSYKDGDLRIYRTYPEKPKAGVKFNVLEVDLSEDFGMYADTGDYPKNFTKEVLDDRLSRNVSTYPYYGLQLSVLNGRIVDNAVAGYSKDRIFLRDRIVVDLFDALSSEKGIDLVMKYRKELRAKNEFEGFSYHMYRIPEISANIKQILEVVKNENIREANKYYFNDCDNSVYYGGKKEGVDYIIISEQNADFVVFIKSKDDYVAFQYAYDLSHNFYKGKDPERDIEEIYFNPEYLYTNETTYHRRISLEYIDNATIEDIFSSDAYLLKIKDGVHSYGRGFLGNFGFDVTHTLNALVEEYDYKKDNGYNGEPEIFYGNMYKSGYYKSKASMRESALYLLGSDYDWHKDGYMVNTDNEYSVTLEDTKAMDIPLGSIDSVYGVCDYTNIVTFPDTITKAWLKEVEEGVKLLVDIVDRTGKHKDDLKMLVKLLSKRTQTKDFVKTFKVV